MTFQGRLRACLEAGNLTVSDLARWFNRPDPTVRGWVRDGIAPSGPARDMSELMSALTRLEIAIRRKEGFPVPRMSQRARRDYIEGLRS